MKRLVFLLFMIIITGCSEQVPEELMCEIDSDCTAAACCHASSCVNMDNKPDCDKIACTMNCEPNTLDCQQGRCACQKNRCTAEFK